MAEKAVESGNIEFFQYLLKNDLLNVNDRSYRSKTYDDYFSTGNNHYQRSCQKVLLYSAIKKGNIEFIKLLISNPNIDINLKSISYIDRSGGCCHSSSSTKIEKSTLYYVIRYGNTEILQLL